MNSRNIAPGQRLCQPERILKPRSPPIRSGPSRTGSAWLISRMFRARSTRWRRRSSFPAGRCFYQFSARGHDLAQILLGLQLTRSDDAVCGYYRSRPCCWRWAFPGRRAGLVHDARRRLFRRPRYRRGVQLSQSATAARRCRCAAGSARSTRRRRAGRRRCNYRATVLKEMPIAAMPSPWCWAATRRSRPTDSGRR